MILLKWDKIKSESNDRSWLFLLYNLIDGILLRLDVDIEYLSDKIVVKVGDNFFNEELVIKKFANNIYLRVIFEMR